MHIIYVIWCRSSESGSAELISDSKCTVFNTGAVACVCPSHIDALCVPDLTKFPYDTQNCSLTLGSWSHSGEEINIRPMGLSGVSIEELEPNGEWELSQIQTVKHDGKYDCCPNTTYPSIRISFIINRLHGSHTASVVVPFLGKNREKCNFPLDSLWLFFFFSNYFSYFYIFMYFTIQWRSFKVMLSQCDCPIHEFTVYILFNTNERR